MIKPIFNRVLSAFSAVLILWVACTPSVVSAQQIRDREAPVIEYSSASTYSPSARQVFSITVTDNIQIDKVILYYRFKGQNTYLQKTMVALSNNVYAATVGTSPDSTLSIEYFIRASDSAGLHANLGYAYQPMTRLISLDRVIEPAAAVSAPATVKDQPAKKSNLPRQLLYVVGGLLVAGVLSSALNDDSGTPTVGPSNDDCQEASCPVIFILPPPQ